MLVRLQNQIDTRNFNEPYIRYDNGAYTVCMRIPGTDEPVECAQYMEESRARGELCELLLVYSAGHKIHYMPENKSPSTYFAEKA